MSWKIVYDMEHLKMFLAWFTQGIRILDISIPELIKYLTVFSKESENLKISVYCSDAIQILDWILDIICNGYHWFVKQNTLAFLGFFFVFVFYFLWK